MAAASTDVSRKILADTETLEALWRQTKNIKTQAFQYFENEPDPYSYALDLMRQASDFGKSKGSSSVPYAVMLALSEWTKKNSISQSLSLEVKRNALQAVLCQKNASLIRLVIRTYRIREDARYFVETVQNLLAQYKFNEAYYCASLLNLQEQFSLDQIVLPLFFQDKREFVIEYVKDYPEMQIELVNILDSVCLEREDMEKLVSTLKVKDIRKCRIDPRWMQKSLWNIVKKFSIPADNCPNLHRLKTKGAIKYLMFKKYIDQSISADSWEELVIDSVQGDPTLKKELLVYLVSYDDLPTALKMTAQLNIPCEVWPEPLKDFAAAKNGTSQTDDNTGMWDEEIDTITHLVDYLSLEINPSNIHLVETKEQFVDCLTDIVENYNIVGVDAEWKPALGLAREKLSLLQIGVSDKIFLIDFISLSPHLQDEHFELLLYKFLSNSNILKIGYGIATDLKMLMKCYHGKRTKFQHTCVLDVGLFYDMFCKRHPEVAQLVKDSTTKTTSNDGVKGLSKLCQVVLGKPLHKDEQFSDWEKRPLRDNQILYAALDAHCLLKIYDTLCSIMARMGLNATATVDEYLSGKWNKPVVKKSAKINAGKKSSQTRNQPSTSCDAPKIPVGIKDIKLVVDNMLQGLGRYLRIYGADVVILENADDHKDAVKFAIAEERVILSNGAPFKQLRGYVPEDMCVYVPETLDAKQQMKHVFKHFNLQITEEDIFSRCSVCNGGKFLEIPSERLMFLWLKYSSSSGAPCQSETLTKGELYDKYCAEMDPGVSIQLENLSSNVFGRVKDFLVCTKCGKVYWWGCHHERMKTSLSSLMPTSEEKQDDITEENTDNVKNPSQQSLERLPLFNSNQVPCPSDERISNSINPPVSPSDADPKNSAATTSHASTSHDLKSHCTKPTIMHFEEDSSDDDTDFIVFDS